MDTKEQFMREFELEKRQEDAFKIFRRGTNEGESVFRNLFNLRDDEEEKGCEAAKREHGVSDLGIIDIGFQCNKKYAC